MEKGTEAKESARTQWWPGRVPGGNISRAWVQREASGHLAGSGGQDEDRQGEGKEGASLVCNGTEDGAGRICGKGLN